MEATIMALELFGIVLIVVGTNLLLFGLLRKLTAFHKDYRKVHNL